MCIPLVAYISAIFLSSLKNAQCPTTTKCPQTLRGGSAGLGSWLRPAPLLPPGGCHRPCGVPCGGRTPPGAQPVTARKLDEGTRPAPAEALVWPAAQVVQAPGVLCCWGHWVGSCCGPAAGRGSTGGVPDPRSVTRCPWRPGQSRGACRLLRPARVGARPGQRSSMSPTHSPRCWAALTHFPWAGLLQPDAGSRG